MARLAAVAALAAAALALPFFFSTGACTRDEGRGCPRFATGAAQSGCTCAEGSVLLAGGCVSRDTADAFCGKGASFDGASCRLRDCPVGQAVDLSSGACLPMGAVREIARNEHVTLAKHETLGCKGDRPAVLEGGHAACVPDDVLCPRGASWRSAPGPSPALAFAAPPALAFPSTSASGAPSVFTLRLPPHAASAFPSASARAFPAASTRPFLPASASASVSISISPFGSGAAPAASVPHAPSGGPRADAGAGSSSLSPRRGTCEAAPVCDAGEVADPESGMCLRVVGAGRHVDVGRWVHAVLGADGGMGTASFCAPYTVRPSLFALNVAGGATFRLRASLELFFPDADVTQLYARFDAFDDVTGQPLPPDVVAFVESSTRPLLEALRAIGGESSAGAVKATVRCVVRTLDHPGAVPRTDELAIPPWSDAGPGDDDEE